jgi:Na+/phosphate symporter
MTPAATIRTRGSCEMTVDTTMIVVAHAAHTITTIAYFVPVIGFLVWLLVVIVRDRRRRGEPHAAGDSAPEGDPE